MRDEKSRGSILIIGSNTRLLPLRDGRTVPTGNYLNETIVPMMRLREAGFGLTVATPDGTKPSLDPRSISASHFGGSANSMNEALAFFQSDISFHKVCSLRTVIKAGLDHFAGVFVPGGHAPIVDLTASSEVGVILRHAHENDKPTALICHGPLATIAALRKPKSFVRAMINGDMAGAEGLSRNWPYRRYQMTIFSNSEEQSVQTDTFGASLLYPVSDALVAAGGLVESGPDYEPFVVEDRELLTGQNPRSDHLLADRFITALGAQTAHQALHTQKGRDNATSS